MAKRRSRRHRKPSGTVALVAALRKILPLITKSKARLSSPAALLAALQELLPSITKSKVKLSNVATLVAALPELLPLIAESGGKLSSTAAALAGLQQQIRQITRSQAALITGGVKAMKAAVRGTTLASTQTLEPVAKGWVELMAEGKEAVEGFTDVLYSELSRGFGDYKDNMSRASQALQGK